MSTYESPSIKIVNKNTNVDNIKNITSENLDNKLENNFVLLSLKNIKYYKSIYNLIFLYRNELNNLFSKSSDIIDKEIGSNLNENNIKHIIKKIEKYISNINYEDYKINISKKDKEILKLLKLFKKITTLNKILNEDMKIISNIDIFNQKTLMSDTSKNNIHKNKMHIIDIFNGYNKNINNNNKLILIDIVDKIKYIIKPNDNSSKSNELSYSLIKLINDYFYKNNSIIDLLCLILNKLNNIDNSIDDLIYTIKENLKNFIIEKDLIDQKIKINSNSLINLEIKYKIKKNKYVLIKENLNIVKNLNKFNCLNSYNSLNDLFKEILNSTIKINNNLNSANFTQIYKFTESYLKQNKKEIAIIILECEKDGINYNIDNLLDSKLTVDKNSGINDIFIKKTNTIIEYPKNDNPEDKITSTYISNIQKIHIINSPYNLDKKNNLTLDIDNYNLDILLIHTNNKNKFDIFTNKDNNLKLKDVLFIFHNKPNYRVENYNNIIENNILNQIEKKNILEEYHKNINFDINTYTPANSVEIKNKIINDIKSKIKLEFNLKNKPVIIEMILEIIVDNISKFIKNKNKIEYSSEIYLTYFSNVNSVINKFKKEVVDNYDNNFISKIGDIVENIQSKIVKIDENIMDKYYYSNMFKN
jgi:hypothetical protein